MFATGLEMHHIVEVINANHSCQLSRFCRDCPGYYSLSRVFPGSIDGLTTMVTYLPQVRYKQLHHLAGSPVPTRPSHAQ